MFYLIEFPFQIDFVCSMYRPRLFLLYTFWFFAKETGKVLPTWMHVGCHITLAIWASYVYSKFLSSSSSYCSRHAINLIFVCFSQQSIHVGTSYCVRLESKFSSSFSNIFMQMEHFHVNKTLMDNIMAELIDFVFLVFLISELPTEEGE